MTWFTIAQFTHCGEPFSFLFFFNFSQHEGVLLLRGHIAFQRVTGLKEPSPFTLNAKRTLRLTFA